MSIGGLRWWNFWSRIDGALYLLRGTHPMSGRVIRAYVGKTFQHPWMKRIDQHLWGRGYGNPAQPWADTILGWTPNGTVKQVIAAGGCKLVWSGRCSPFGLWWREILMILLLRPKYNYQWNKANRSRITKTNAQQQRERRDRTGSSYPPVVGELLSVRRWLGALAAVGVAGVLLIPGAPGAVADSARWGWDNALGLLILGMFAVLLVRIPRRKRRR